MQDNLGNTPVYEVGNVAEYMECIRRHHLEGCISRGEDRAYPHLSAAAFRRNSSLDIRKHSPGCRPCVWNMFSSGQQNPQEPELPA